MSIDKDEKRMQNIEMAIQKLTILTERQEKQNGKLIDAINGFNLVKQEVGNNSKAITDLNRELHDISDVVNANRLHCDNLGNEKLRVGLTIGVSIVVFAFGYLYTDIQTLNKSRHRYAVENSKMKTELKYLKEEVNKCQRKFK